MVTSPGAEHVRVDRVVRVDGGGTNVVGIGSGIGGEVAVEETLRCDDDVRPVTGGDIEQVKEAVKIAIRIAALGYGANLGDRQTAGHGGVIYIGKETDP